MQHTVTVQPKVTHIISANNAKYFGTFVVYQNTATIELNSIQGNITTNNTGNIYTFLFNKNTDCTIIAVSGKMY